MFDTSDKKEHKQHAEHKAAPEAHKEHQHASKETDDLLIAPAEFERLKQEAESAEGYRDRLLRLQAEFDNARKRMERERLEFVKYANEGILLELLNILDDLERSIEARNANHQDPAAFLKGIEMILAHLYEMLKRNGVKALEAKGKKFDPHAHEALMQEERDDVEDDVVIEEFQKGYMLEDRVIRTAKVKVAKRKEIKDIKAQEHKEQEEKDNKEI